MQAAGQFGVGRGQVAAGSTPQPHALRRDIGPGALTVPLELTRPPRTGRGFPATASIGSRTSPAWPAAGGAATSAQRGRPSPGVGLPYPDSPTTSIIEHVFDHESEAIGRTHRPLDPPLPVWVDCARMLQPRAQVRMDTVRMRVRAYGLDASRVIPGELLGWYQLMVGGHWGLVRCTLASRNERVHLEVTQLAPADALSPR